MPKRPLSRHESSIDPDFPIGAPHAIRWPNGPPSSDLPRVLDEYARAMGIAVTRMVPGGITVLRSSDNTVEVVTTCTLERGCIGHCTTCKLCLLHCTCEKKFETAVRRIKL